MDCSDKWKFDKIDKIFIAFISAFVAVFCVIETFCFGADLEVYDDLGYNAQVNEVIANSSSQYFYYKLQKGVEYTIKNEQSIGNLGIALISDVPSPGVPGKFLTILSPGSEVYTFVANDEVFLFLFGWSSSLIDISSISISSKASFSGAVSDLVNYVGISNFWNIFENSVSYIFVVTVFSLGILLIITSIKGVSKGKGLL